MSYDYRTSKYKNERDSYKRDLESKTTEFNELKNALLKILDNANSSSDTYELSYDDFKYYFLAATSSKEDVMRDQFDALLLTSIMLFGEDLQNIKNEISRRNREQIEYIEKSKLAHLKNKKEYDLLVSTRLIEKKDCIERRKNILQKISSGRYVIEDFNTLDKQDIVALYNTGHIRTSIIFSRLLVKKFDNIPTDHDDDYYKATDHSYYKSLRYGGFSGFSGRFVSYW